MKITPIKMNAKERLLCNGSHYNTSNVIHFSGESDSAILHFGGTTLPDAKTCLLGILNARKEIKISNFQEAIIEDSFIARADTITLENIHGDISCTLKEYDTWINYPLQFPSLTFAYKCQQENEKPLSKCVKEKPLKEVLDEADDIIWKIRNGFVMS